jgi:nicotinamidase-related amidase
MERVYGLEIPRSLQEVCRPDRLALLVYDLQAGIVVQLPDGAEVTRRAAEVLEAARDGGYRVFYTRHMSLPKEVADIPVIVTDACGSRDKPAAERALTGLRFTGGSYETDVATLCRLMRATARARSAAAGEQSSRF